MLHSKQRLAVTSDGAWPVTHLHLCILFVVSCGTCKCKVACMGKWTLICYIIPFIHNEKCDNKNK